MPRPLCRARIRCWSAVWAVTSAGQVSALSSAVRQLVPSAQCPVPSAQCLTMAVCQAGESGPPQERRFPIRDLQCSAVQVFSV
jgi:hypothetical protein